MTDLYNKEILRLTLAIPKQEQRLENPTRTLHRRSRICGSTLDLDVMMDDAGTITDFGWTVKACALGQASAAIIGQQMIGMTEDRLMTLKGHMDDMLRDGQTVDWDTVMDGDFSAMKHLEAARDHSGRFGAIYLPVDIMKQLWW